MVLVGHLLIQWNPQTLAQQAWPVAQPTALQLVSGGGISRPFPISFTASSGVSVAVSLRMRVCSNGFPESGAKTVPDSEAKVEAEARDEVPRDPGGPDDPRD